MFITKKQLREGNILGIIDSYGAVHSKYTESVKCHEEFWACQTHCRWRWNDNRGIYWFLGQDKPNEEQSDAIRRHLSRKYGLKWWENGHHDIDDLNKKDKKRT